MNSWSATCDVLTHRWIAVTWRRRLHTYEQLVGYLRCSYTSVDCRNMEKAIDGLIAWISSSNYKVISFCVFLIDTTLSLLYTHADRQGVDCGYYRLLFACYRHADKQGCCRKGFDILFTLCVCVCVCMVQISPPTIKLAVSNFAWWFTSVLGRESPILGNFAPPDANWPSTGK